MMLFMKDDEKKIQERKTRLKRRYDELCDTKFTDEKKEDVLELIANGFGVKEACRIYNLNYTTVLDARDLDPDFDKAWTLALREQADLIEETALQRALQGVDKPVWFQGEQVGADKQYDNNLLITMLKAAKPEKYKDRKEVTGAGGGPVSLNIISYAEDFKNGRQEGLGKEPVQGHEVAQPPQISKHEDDAEEVGPDLREEGPDFED